MTSNETNGIQKDMVAEAVRVAEKADQEDVALRLLGGVAIKVRATEGLQPAFEREYADLDWITPKGNSSRGQKFFESLGYVPQSRFNTMYGRERLRLWSLAHLHGQPRSPRRPPVALRPSLRRQATHQGPHRTLAGAHRGGAQGLRLEDAGEVWRLQTLVRAARGGGRRTMRSRLFSHEPDTRNFLATDIHGSETCWRKFLNGGKHYEADVMVLGGDMTGKALIPKVEQAGVATTRAAPTRTR